MNLISVHAFIVTYCEQIIFLTQNCATTTYSVQKSIYYTEAPIKESSACIVRIQTHVHSSNNASKK